MKTQYKFKFLIIFAVIGFFLYKIYPPSEKIKKGLDLQGGVYVVLEVEKSPEEKENISELTDRALEVIRNRIDALGVTEPVIHKEGMKRIIVELPGVKNPQKAIEIIGKTALLEFKLVIEDEKLLKKAEEGKIPEVRLEFNKEGAKKFDEITRKNIGKRLAIILDGVVKSAPVIRDRIRNGRARITGNFTLDEAKELALVLRAGALPAKVSMIYQEVVGPTLGKSYIRMGFRASLYGGIIVLFFMMIYYLAFGLLADFAVTLNILILLGILATFKGVLTLPGIAGIALTCGMAVDANVLIFERIREELKTGKTPRACVDAGYLRAWSAIIDSNITTLIVGLILFFLGEGPIKGFGLTLSIGIIANLFTAVFVTKTIVDWIFTNRRIETIRI